MPFAGAAGARAAATMAGAHDHHRASFRGSRQSAQSSTHEIYHEAESPSLSRRPSDEGAHDGAGAGAKNETLPPTDARIITGALEKKTMKAEGLHWQPRNAVLSADHLSFGKFFLDWYARGLRERSVRLTLLLRVLLPRSMESGKLACFPDSMLYSNLALFFNVWLYVSVRG